MSWNLYFNWIESNSAYSWTPIQWKFLTDSYTCSLSPYFVRILTHDNHIFLSYETLFKSRYHLNELLKLYLRRTWALIIRNNDEMKHFPFRIIIITINPKNRKIQLIEKIIFYIFYIESKHLIFINLETYCWKFVNY